jgi:5-methylcytosine-specific restriction endonuclease McrA
VPDDVRFCAECQAERNRVTKTDDGIAEHSLSYDEELDKQRKSARWQTVRKKALARCPMCARCQLHVSEIADHIVPARVAVQQARDSGKYPFDHWAGYYILCNIQGLCRECHYQKTIEDKTHVGEWPNVVEQHLAQPKKVWTF